MHPKIVEHIVTLIKRCYSPASLAQAATEMGETIIPGEDIFSTLIRSGRALDRETAVTLVMCHLEDEATHFDDIPMFLRKERRSGSDSSH